MEFIRGLCYAAVTSAPVTNFLQFHLSEEDDPTFKDCAVADPSWQTACEQSAALRTAAVSVGSRAVPKICEEVVKIVIIANDCHYHQYRQKLQSLIFGVFVVAQSLQEQYVADPYQRGFGN